MCGVSINHSFHAPFSDVDIFLKINFIIWENYMLQRRIFSRYEKENSTIRNYLHKLLFCNDKNKFLYKT